MSLTMTKAEGVTVFTLTSDPQSACPPLCQIFKGLCYSPVCCSVSQHLRKVQRTSPSLLGALHIMVGLLNIGLGLLLLNGSGAAWWQMSESLFPLWFGGLFILFGIMSILSEKCPSRCLVILNVILNVAGVLFAVAAVALYTVSIFNIDLWWLCHREDYPYYTTPSPSPQEKIIMEKCLEGSALVLLLMRSITVVLIVLSVLELCVTISSVVLGIKGLRTESRLRTSDKKENKSIDEPELYNPLLEEVTSYPAA